MNSPGYANLPIGKPPPGVVPNLDHPQSQTIAQYVGIGICLGVALVFVLLRIYVKLAVTRAWGWDDGELLHAITFLEADCSRGLPFGICETCRSFSLLNCSEKIWHRGGP